MINIVFWSPNSGQTGTTSNIIAVSALAALTLGKKICITHTHFKDQSMESALFGKGLNNDLLENMGIDLLIKASKAHDIGKDVIENTTFTLLRGLHVLPGTAKTNETLFEDEFLMTREHIYRGLSKSFDIVFTDVMSGTNKISEVLLETADIVVINLNQNNRVIGKYLDEYFHLDKRAVYIISNYHEDSKYNIQNLKRSYPFLKKRSTFIPYDTNYMDYYCDGRVVPFFLKNTLASHQEDKYFFEQVRKTLEMIMNVSDQKEEERCC